MAGPLEPRPIGRLSGRAGRRARQARIEHDTMKLTVACGCPQLIGEPFAVQNHFLLTCWTATAKPLKVGARSGSEATRFLTPLADQSRATSFVVLAFVAVEWERVQLDKHIRPPVGSAGGPRCGCVQLRPSARHLRPARRPDRRRGNCPLQLRACPRRKSLRPQRSTPRTRNNGFVSRLVSPPEIAESWS